MDKKKGLGVATGVVALMVSVIAVTLSYASYTSSLTIKGAATAKKAKWSVVFTDLQTVSATQTGTTGNDANLPVTATEKVAPTIVGDTSIETYSVELKTPGDFVSYRFKITNNGDFRAKIDTGFSLPTPSCTNGASSTNSSDATNVCGNLEYTLNYITGTTVGDAVKSGDTFAVGDSKEVILKIKYKETNDESKLPTDDVTIGNLNITIPFVQY